MPDRPRTRLPRPRPPRARLAAAAAALLVLTAAADVALLGLRLASLVEDADLAPTTGIEEPSIRAVWKAQHGLPVYGPPEGAASLPLYNWLFYASYGSVARIFGEGPRSIMLFGRLFNAVLLVAGAVATVGLTRILLRSLGLPPGGPVPIAVALVVWFGSGLVRWYALTVRPDGAATALAAVGLWLVARAWAGGRARERLLLGAASIAFFLAWSFKQTAVLLLAGSVLFLALERRFRALPWLVAPFGAMAAACVAALGPHWIDCALRAPALSPADPEHFRFVVVRALYPSAVLWFLPVAYLLARRDEPAPAPLRLLTACAGTAFLGGAALALKQGSYVYYFWEAFVTFGALTCAAVAALRRSPPRLLAGAAVVGAGLLLAGSALQLAVPGRWSRVDLLSDRAAETVRRRIAFVRELPGPVFSEDRILALPWYAGHGTAGSVLDPVLYRAPHVHRLVGGGVSGAIRSGRYASVLVTSRDRFRLGEAARAAGLVPQPVPAELGDLRLLIRPGPDDALTPDPAVTTREGPAR